MRGANGLNVIKIPVFALLAVGVLAGSAQASGADGVWIRSDGMAKVQFAPCGSGSCGTIVWLKDPANSRATVGQQVFFGMGQTSPRPGPGRHTIPRTGAITTAP